MKNNILKVLYCIIFLLSTICLIFLIINPIKSGVPRSNYEENEIIYKTFNSNVKINIKLHSSDVYQLMYYINSVNDINNWNVSLIDDKNNIIFSTFIKKYKANIMYFNFEPLKKDVNYTLIIEDKDNDNIELAITESNDESYLIGEKDITAQLVFYSYKDDWTYLWYPLFLFTLLFTFYPFVWGDNKNEKKI